MLIPHLNKNLNQDFSQVYKRIVTNYYFNVIKKANLNEQNKNNDDALKYYRLCYEIIDCLRIDNHFPFNV